MTANVRVRWLARSHSTVVVFLRLLVVVVAVGLSGLAPTVAAVIARDVAFHDACDTSGCSDCPLDQDGKECPPGCPSCHCSHVGVGLPPAGAFVLRTVNQEFEAAAVPYEAAVPRAPPASDVYRPPRGVVTFS